MTDTTPRLYRDTDGDWWAATSEGGLVCLTDDALGHGAPHAHVDRMYGPLTHVPLADAADLAQARRRIAEETDAAGAARGQVFYLSALLRESIEVLAEFIADCTDPGTAALGLLHRLRHADLAPATTTEPDQ